MAGKKAHVGVEAYCILCRESLLDVRRKLVTPEPDQDSPVDAWRKDGVVCESEY
jgi:hypothetical protein